MNGEADVARNIINKVREFKVNSLSKEKLLKELLDDPSKSNNDHVLKEVEKSATIVKELFTLLDEFDMMEGNVSYLNED
jgi:type III secretion system FlhB-like substrate exporter